MYKKYLEGENIFLREVRESDVTDEYYNWLNDPDVNKYLETRFIPHSKNDILNFVKKMDGNNNEILFAICEKETEKHIGNIKLGPINWIHRKADISFLIGNKAYWNKGIASEAIKLVLRYGFYTLNLHKICAGYYKHNIGSAKALKKCGFIEEGVLREEYYYNGEYVDAIRVGILKKDYFSLK